MMSLIVVTLSLEALHARNDVYESDAGWWIQSSAFCLDDLVISLASLSFPLSLPWALTRTLTTEQAYTAALDGHLVIH